MTVKLFCRIYAIIHIVIFSCLSAFSGTQVEGEINRTTLQDYLGVLGAQLDCYFTVESVGCSGDHENPILDGFISVPEKELNDINSLLSFLNNDVEVSWVGEGKTNTIHLVAKKFEETGQIVMICDERLGKVDNYALTNKVSVTCNRTPLYLLSRLSAKEPLVKLHDRFRLSKSSSLDRRTPIMVCATNESIRSVMTMCVPLEGYSRVIWSADTNGEADSPEIRVEFYGRRPTKSVKDCLLALGNKFDCYFTVESVGSLNILRKRIDSELLTVTGLDQALNMLSEELRYERHLLGEKYIARFTAREDESCNGIIRIRDSSLKAVMDYFLNEKMSLKFNGTPTGLIEFLSTKNPRIQKLNFGLIGDYLHGFMGSDIVSPIEIDQTNTSVRNILTTCISLEEYNRIVWSSYTDVHEDSPIVRVCYYGKARPSDGMRFKIMNERGESRDVVIP